MNSFYDFASAALPWIVMGLLLAIFIVRFKRKKTNPDKESNDYSAEGMALGMCLGVAMSTSMHIDVGIGLVTGMVLGLLIGSRMEKDGE